MATPTTASLNTVTQDYSNILFRSANLATEITPWANALDAFNAGTNTIWSPSAIATAISLSAEAQNDVLPIVRLYQAAFNRAPDIAGLQAWVNGLRNGMSFNTIVTGFVNSAEFAATYGSANPAATTLLPMLYANVLGRAPDAVGFAAWANAMANGMSIASVVTGFVNSTEFITNSSPVIDAWLTTYAATNTYVNSIAIGDHGAPATGTTFTLTTGVDIATAGNFLGSLATFNNDGHGPTLTVGDVLTGSGNNATLTLDDAYASGTDIIAAGVTLNNIANVVLNTANNAGVGAGQAFDTSPYSSVTNTTVTSSGGGNDFVKAGASSAINLTHNASTGTATVFGGKDVSVTTNGLGVTVGGTGTGQLPAGNVSITENGSGVGAATTTVRGGQNVSVTISQTNAGGNIAIGNTTANILTTNYNPSGAISVTSASQVGAANTDTIFGGTTVNVAVQGDTVVIGNAAAKSTSNQPSGNVTVTDTLAQAFDNLTGPGSSHNNVLGGKVSVYGGSNVNVTTNTGGGVVVGASNVAGTYPTGTVTVTDTSSDLKGAFGIGAYVGATGTQIVGGTAVTVNEAGGPVTIGYAVGGATASDNPSGAINVTETIASTQAVTIDGGNGVTVAAQGQAVTIGANTGTSGAQSVTQSSVYTGNALGNSNAGSAVTVDGGTTVTVSTTGGNVSVGSAAITIGGSAAPTGAVSITNTFSGAGAANGSTVSVLGGSTVSITETNTTSGAITVGTAPVLNAAGTALKNAALDPTGNVTINNSVTNNGTTTYGTSATTVYTNGSTVVSVTGAGATTIADVNSFTATATGNAVGTSSLGTVNLDGVTGAVAIYSDALSSLTIADSLKGSTATTVNTTVAAGYTAEPAHTLAVTLSNDTNTSTKVTDPTATGITVYTTGSTADNIGIVAAKATSLTFSNNAAVTVQGAVTLSATANETVTANGSGALTLGNTTAWTNPSKLASIDVSGSSGAVSAEINGNVTSFKGGSGNVTLTVDTGAGQSIAAGTGTNNTVILTAAATAYNPVLNPTGPISADFTNFQNLGLGTNTTGAYDVSGFSSVIVSGAYAGAVTANNAGAGETLVFTAAPGTTTAWNLKTDTSSDALTITIGADGTTAAGLAANAVTTGAGAAGGIETVTVNSVGKSTMTGANTITLADAHTKTTTLDITGDAAATITAADGTITKIVVTDTAKVDVSAVVAAASGVTITGGAGLLTASTNTANTAVTSIDSVTTGAGGGKITLGQGGAGGLAGSTGSENVNLTASAGVRDTIIAHTSGVDIGTRGIIAGFTDSASQASDVLQLDVAHTIVANKATITGASGATYSVSNGMFTLLSGAPTALTELQDVQGLVEGNTVGGFGGASSFGAVTISGTTYVVASNSTGAAGFLTTQDGAQDTIFQLTGVSGVTGFGLASVDGVKIGAGATIDLASTAGAITLGNAGNTGSAIAGTTNTYIDTGYAIDGMTVASVSGVTNNYTNLAAFAELNIGNAGMTGGNVSVTQVGVSGTNELVIMGAAGGGTLDTFTVNGDYALVLDSTTAGYTLNSLVDGTNTVSTIYTTGANSIDVKAITDTALTKIDGSAMTGGTLTLGDTTALSQNSLTVKVGGGAALNVTVSGNSDAITGGNASDTIVASGASNAIADGSGVNTITASGPTTTINLGSLATGAAIGNAQTIHASGAGDTIAFLSTAADGTAITYTAASTVDGGSGALGIGNNSTVTFGTNGVGGSQTIVLTGDVTGGNSASYAFTTFNHVVDAAGDILTFNNATTEITAGATLGQSQVNVASATSLAQALDLAAATAAMSQQSGSNAAGKIAAHTGVVDWFQYGGNTYIVEDVNSGSSSATHTALGANDAVIKIVGLVNLDAAHAVTFGGGHTITL